MNASNKLPKINTAERILQLQIPLLDDDITRMKEGVTAKRRWKDKILTTSLKPRRPNYYPLNNITKLPISPKVGQIRK